MIEITNLSRYFGSIHAVDGISFSISPGEIVGFLGPNGAGKTTTMRMMVGFLQPSQGSIRINDKNIYDDPIATSQAIGYLPESNPLYEDMIVYDYLRYVASLRGMKATHFAQRLDFVVKKCGLSAVMGQLIGTLSKGYRQRTGLAQAIIHDPSILILDEPTSGLDPNQIMEIRELIRELGESKTVILSSHIMQEVQALCDRVIIINQGKIIADDNKTRLSQSFADRIRLYTEIDKEVPDTLSTNLPDDIIEVERSYANGITTLVFEADESVDIKREVAKYLSQSGLMVLGMYIRQYSLEEIFHNLTQSPATSSVASESIPSSEEVDSDLEDKKDE